MVAIIQETLLKINERNEIEIGSTANGNALKKQKKRWREKNRFRTRKDTELFRAIIFSMREPAGSQGHRIPGLLLRRKKRRKKGDRKNGERDANIFASRRSQQGESVQKVSLRQRQVITYTHEGGIQGGGELPGRDLRLGRHLLEWP